MAAAFPPALLDQVADLLTVIGNCASQVASAQSLRQTVTSATLTATSKIIASADALLIEFPNCHVTIEKNVAGSWVFKASSEGAIEVHGLQEGETMLRVRVDHPGLTLLGVKAGS